MMNCAGIWLCLLVVVGGQDDVDMQRRRFKQAINAYLSRAKAREMLADVILERAEAMKLSDEKLKSLQSDYKNAISKFVDQQSQKWAQDSFSEKKNSAMFRAQSNSLTRSTSLIEKSKPWRAMLASVLDETELKAWVAHRDRELASEEAAIQQVVEAAAKAEQKRRASREAKAVTFAQQIGNANVPAEQFRRIRPEMKDQCQVFLEVTQRNAKRRLSREITCLDELFQLNARQTRKLELAISGVVSRAFRDKLAKVNAINIESAETDKEADAQVATMLEIFQKLAPPLTPMRAAMVPQELDSKFDYLTQEPLWQRALGSTLSEKQLGAFQAEKAARTKFHRDVRVREVVLLFDQLLRLRIDQREKLIELLHADPTELNHLLTAEQAYRSFPDELSTKVDQVLTDTQRAKLTQ